MSHTTIRNGGLFCTNCGGAHPFKFPVPISDMTNIMEAFNVLHENCEKVWSEPLVDPNLSMEARIVWWWEHGERGASSECIWKHMLDLKISTPYTPSDADDFKRCHKLLLVVPEWREQLAKMKAVSQEWSGLVDQWDQLDSLFLNQQHKELNQLMDACKTT